MADADSGSKSERAWVIVPCWRAVDDALAQEIKQFWQREHVAMAQDEAERRAREAVVVVRDVKHELAAIVTVQPRLIPFLGETLYYLRVFVAPRARAAWLPLRMLREAQTLLAADAASATPASVAIGIMLELENPGFARIAKRAVWRHSGFFYAGHTPRGFERRIWYFPGALLQRAGLARGRPSV